MSEYVSEPKVVSVANKAYKMSFACDERAEYKVSHEHKNVHICAE